MTFGKLTLRNYIAFLIMKLLLWILLFFLQLAALSRFYSEVCVGLRVIRLRNHCRALLILGKLPHRVLSHVPIFERFYLGADAF